MGLRRNDEINALIANSGVEIIRLREANHSDQKKADRMFHHLSKAMEGDERSKEILDKEKNKNRRMIFSRTDQWRVD
jgi:hypothetical protein